MADLKITGLHKRYGAVHAVRGIDLEIPAGEFAVLVGPSGCGKSTLLRTIAGLEEADAGTIEIGERVMNHVRPRDRDIAMVFQNYALYPYMSVFENVAFGLRARRVAKAEIEERVRRAADMLGITPLLDRLPRQLSGGQRQRVAIGRAIVRDARLFLFDEPLSNLDAQLRDEMRSEIKRLHQEIGKTMIYVTHDQIEAMTLADRIVLLKDGLIEQAGTPLDLFERPRTRFVAGFLGSPQMNFVPGRIVRNGDAHLFEIGDGVRLALAGAPKANAEPLPAVLGIRPEHMRRATDSQPAPGHVRLPITIELVQPTGSRTYVNFAIAGHPVIAELAAHDAHGPGERIEIDIDMNRAILLDRDSGIVLAGGVRANPKIRENAMPAIHASLPIRLLGTEVPDVKGRTLQAGPLSAVLDNGSLRYIRLGETEVLRGIAFLVRDENWGTFAPVITNLVVSESKDSFVITFEAKCADAHRSISYSASIVGKADGSLRFDAEARPDTDFLTNRTGFVVLHPLAGVAGHPATIEHVDGTIVESEFPAIIDPDCPFRGIRALTHQVAPGLTATCRMDGYTFEMEDHRNWTDASFKTYVRPLAEPWPYTMPAGESFKQSVSLTFDGPRPAVGGTAARPAPTVSLGAGPGGTMPKIGIGVLEEEAAHSAKAAAAVKQAGPQLLVCQIDARHGDGAAAARHYKALAEATGAEIVLEVIIPGKPGADSPARELAPVVAAARAAGLAPAAVCVSPAPHLKAVLPGSKGPPCCEYADVFRAARAAFPGAKLGGGMLSYFTELNRNKPPADLLDYVTHTTCPIVHAADDTSVMETLETLPYVIQSMRTFIAGKPYRVGPSAIPARDNPYGMATSANPDNGRVCLAKMDPRQRGLFGAAWTLGYIAAFAKGGLEAVTIGAPTGPSGLIARKTDYAQPYFDELTGIGLYPVYHVIKGLAAAAGSELLDVASSDQARVVALAHRSAGHTTVWLGNLGDAEITVNVPDASADAKVLAIDADSFAELTTDTDFLSRPGQTLAANGMVRLGPYAVARIAW